MALYHAGVSHPHHRDVAPSASAREPGTIEAQPLGVGYRIWWDARTPPQVGLSIALAVPSAGIATAELKSHTVEAFDRYVQVTEERMRTELDGEAPFLWIDRQEGAREEHYRTLQSGRVVVQKLETRAAGDRITISDGMIHHWVGTVLIPGTTLEQTIAMVQDYAQYSTIYAPQVRESRLVSQDGNRFRVFARLHEKKILTFVSNTEYDAEFVYLDHRRVHVASRTTRIAEVVHPDTPEEREKPVGNDRGILWRFYNYCSFEERTGDTYMQCESISLSRGLNLFLSVLVKPFISGVPKDKMTFTLEAARRHLTE